MTGLNHGMTGAVIALVVKEPILAIPLSFVSHFLQDTIPHWDYSSGKDRENLFKRKFNILLLADFLLAVTTMVVLGSIFPSQRWLIWGCMIAAASPDLMWAYYRLYGEHLQKRKIQLGRLARFHVWVENEVSYGPYVEAGWLILTALIIALLK